MRGHRSPLDLGILFTVLAATFALPTETTAQSGGPGFLFNQPQGRFGIWGGYAIPQAGSGVFDFVQELLTVDKSDFRSSAWRAELAMRATNRFDVAFEVGLSHSQTQSEMRDWVDLDNLAIEQATAFTRVPVTLSLKRYFRDRGRSIGQFAFIPERWSPFVGAGAGLLWYKFSQQGDFVDFQTLDIYYDSLASKGTTPTAHLFAGADVTLGSRFIVSGEGRYSWAHTGMNNFAFEGFDDINLDGFQVMLGLSLTF